MAADGGQTGRGVPEGKVWTDERKNERKIEPRQRTAGEYRLVLFRPLIVMNFYT